MTDWKKRIRDITSGLVICLLAAAVFMYVWIRLQFSFAASLAIAAVIALLLLLAFGPTRSLLRRLRRINVQVPDSHDVRRILLRNYVREIAAKSKTVREPKLSECARDIAKSAAAILRKVEKQPGRYRMLHRYFDHYLQSAISILNRCEALTNSPVFDREMDRQIQQAEQVLRRLKKQLDRQMIGVLQHDVWELEVERRTLDKLMDETFSIDQAEEER